MGLTSIIKKNKVISLYKWDGKNAIPIFIN